MNEIAIHPDDSAHIPAFGARIDGEPDGIAEHELVWRTLEGAEPEMYHECQAWAIREYLAQRSRVV